VSKLVGRALTTDLLARLSQRDLARYLGAALPLVTLDADGRPHPMLISYLEIRAYDAGSVGLVIQAGSDSARNLGARNVATLVIVDANIVAYVKLKRLDGPLAVAESHLTATGRQGSEDARLAYFMFAVEEVREDTATEEEAGARIVAGPRYAPAPALDSAWARIMLAALATPRARA
jgi:hypothetical protein